MLLACQDLQLLHGQSTLQERQPALAHWDELAQDFICHSSAFQEGPGLAWTGPFYDDQLRVPNSMQQPACKGTVTHAGKASDQPSVCRLQC